MDDEYKSKNYKNIEFTYSNDGVETNPNIENPKKVYKFYALNEKNVKALSDNCLFASHPYHLNDSFDSSDKILNCSTINEPLFKGFYKNLLKEDYCDKKISELFRAC